MIAHASAFSEEVSHAIGDCFVSNGDGHGADCLLTAHGETILQPFEYALKQRHILPRYPAGSPLQDQFNPAFGSTNRYDARLHRHV